MTAPFDYSQAILAQYANSPTLMQLCASTAGYFDQSAALDAFFSLVWNVDTAQGWGLDVWGRIVGASRTITANVSGKFLGFEEAGTSGLGAMNEAPFYAGTIVNQNFVLSDALYRPLIIAKAFANICDGSILSLNTMLRTLFPGRGNIYVTDGADKTMTITSTFALSAVEVAMLTTAGIFPRPAGMSLSLISP